MFNYYIGGEFKKSRIPLKVLNPSNEEIIAEFFSTSSEDIDYSLKKAREAQEKWRNFPFKERAKILREIGGAILDNLNILAELETKEIGKPLKESLFVDIPLGAECFNYYASFLESLQEEAIELEGGYSVLKYEPFGVCAVYLPYNVPVMSFGFSCAASLAAGNAIIVKPSEYGSLSLLELAKHLDKLDIPSGLINIITGKGETVGKYLAESEIEIISFTGSRETLKKIISYTSSNPKKIICELGGCNLAVVFSDADRNKSLQNILASCFIKGGQACIGTSLILVEEQIYSDFIKSLIEKVSCIKVADPFLPDTGIGPLPTPEHLKKVEEEVSFLKNRGGKVLYGGERLKQKGYFFPPTIIEIKEVIYKELFSPLVMVKSFKDKEVEEIIKNNPYGLVLQIWTKELKKAQKLARDCCYGTVWINTSVQMSSQTPFGGMKKSGWGRNLGKSGFFEYIQPKHIGIGFKETPLEEWFGI